MATIRYKYECPKCNIDVYFACEINTKKYVCPECRDRNLRVAGYKKEGNLETFELMHKLADLEARVEKLQEFLNQDDLKRFLVS